MAVLVDMVRNDTVELGQKTTIGRDPECDLSLPEQPVSRFHAEIRKTPEGRHLIVDMNSTHGTYVSGKRIVEHVLEEGDIVVIGGTSLRFLKQASDATDPRFRSIGPPADYDSTAHYPKLESAWPTGADFLANLQSHEGPGRLFYPAPAGRDLPPDAKIGALLSVYIRLLDRQVPEFHLHARVLERRSAGENQGLLLEFVAEEKDRQELVIACAEGESIPHFRRRHERIPCQLPVRVKAGKSGKHESTAVQISAGGMFLALDRRLDRDQVVDLYVSFPDLKKPLHIRGRVAAVVPEGPQKGVGIEFLFKSGEQQELVANQVAMLKSKLPG